MLGEWKLDGLASSLQREPVRDSQGVGEHSSHSRNHACLVVPFKVPTSGALLEGLWGQTGCLDKIAGVWDIPRHGLVNGLGSRVILICRLGEGKVSVLARRGIVFMGFFL